MSAYLSNVCFAFSFFTIVTLNAAGEPTKKERNLEAHCGWFYTKLYVMNSSISNPLRDEFLDPHGI